MEKIEELPAGEIYRLPVEDALLVARYIRNKVSAHRMHKSAGLAPYLSVLEARNIQDLARMLLLSRLGLWEFVKYKA